ncbi:sulfonate ABC transporter substrate-binding protein [Pediococcus acidilactici]|nr:sulfonate ABC transporter substrate-binding protein [Pediococcus acidilactici]
MGIAPLLNGCQKTSKETLRTVKIGVLNVPNDVLTARQDHTLVSALKKQGYRPEFITFDSGVDANKALMSNDIQMATMGHTNAVVAMSVGIPVKLIWLNDVIGSNEQLILQKGIKFSNWDDLRGKSIATPFASTSHYSLMMLLKKHHLIGKVKLYDMQTTEIVAAWKQKNIDAAYTWEPSLSNLNDGCKVVDSGTLAQSGIMTANVTLATDQFIKKEPKILETILRVLNKEHQQYQSDSKVIYRRTAEGLGVNTTITRKQIGTSQWLSREEQTRLLKGEFIRQFFKTADFMYQQQTISKQPDEQKCRQFISTKYLQ